MGDDLIPIGSGELIDNPCACGRQMREQRPDDGVMMFGGDGSATSICDACGATTIRSGPVRVVGIGELIEGRPVADCLPPGESS